MQLPCPRCGIGMPGPKDRFWCPDCKAYFCQNCVLPSSKCPNCEKRLYEPESKTNRRVNTVLAIVIVIVLSIPTAMLLSFQVDTTPDEITPIASASPGRTVRLFGTIDSSNVTAFVLDLGESEWMLRTYRPFLLVDTKDPSTNITVDVGNCRNFYHSAHFIKGDTNCSYLDGDNITVVGDVRSNASGGKVLYATTVMSWYSSQPDSSFLSYIMFLPMLLVAVMLVAIFKSDNRQNRRYHADFIATHAGKPFAPRKDENGPARSALQAQAGPPLTVDTLGEPFNVEWIPNNMYKNYRKYSILIVTAVFAIGILLGLMWAGGIVSSSGGGPSLIQVMTIVFLVLGAVFVVMVTAMTNAVPTHAAVLSKGLYLKYNKPTRFQRLQSAAWTEITDIPNARAVAQDAETKTSYLQLKAGDTTYYVELDRALSMRIIEAWRRHRPAEEIKKEEAEKRHKEELVKLQKEVEEKGGVEWVVNTSMAAFERSQRNLLRLMLIVFAIPEAMAVALFIGTGFNPAVALIIIVLLAPFLLVLSLERMTDIKRNKISEMGFSEQGIHFRFAEKDPKEEPVEFMPWSDIREMAPPAGLTLAVLAGDDQKEISWINLDDSLLQRAARELDERRNGTCRAPANEAPETVRNPLYMKLWYRTYVPLALLAGSILAATVTIYLFGLIAVLVFMAICIGLFFLVLMTVPFAYYQLRWAPETVLFFGSGVGFSFGKRPVPHGSADFLAWEALDRLSPAEDEKGRLRGEMPDDRPGMKSLIAVKKSGTRWVAGPFDTALMERIRSEHSRRA